MTYGWAILVIAVVLAALYSLGIFNPNTFAPKASAGSCEVVRPFGPTTTTDVHLEGTCTNMLPKYVANIGFSNSYISTNNKVNLNDNIMSSGYTMTIWFYEPSSASSVNVGCPTTPIVEIRNPSIPFPWTGIEAQCGTTPGTIMIICVSNSGGTCGNGGTYAAASNLAPNRWYLLSATYTKGNLKIYTNGKLIQDHSTSQTFNALSYAKIYMGGVPNGGWGVGAPFKIANVQVYNIALSANQISALYQEGIGGAPIDLTNLVGWWPLNGNANDYSGNKNNGKGYNVSYPSTWYKTYSAP